MLLTILVTRGFEATVTGVTAGDARLRGDGAYDKILLFLTRVLVLTCVRWFRSILTSLATNAARLTLAASFIVCSSF